MSDLVRILGSCMVFGGCLGLGFWYRFQMEGRIRTIRDMGHILELLAGEIRYGRNTLPECCSHVARYLQEPFCGAFLRIGNKMTENTGISFGEVFREEMAEVLKALPLKEEDRENFLKFTFQGGFMDGQMQLRAVEQSIDLLKSTEEKLEKENAEKSRMAVGLGAMSGLLLILVLW